MKFVDKEGTIRHQVGVKVARSSTSPRRSYRGLEVWTTGGFPCFVNTVGLTQMISPDGTTTTIRMFGPMAGRPDIAMESIPYVWKRAVVG